MKPFLLTLLGAFILSLGCPSCRSVSLDLESGLSHSNVPFIVFSDITKDSLLSLCAQSENRGKSLGILGGSYTIAPGSELLQNKWKEHLDVDIHNYGISGFGFSRYQGSIQDEADKCGIHDIYLLWASTNDFNFNRPVGVPSDYTLFDGYNEKNRNTQCGGINYCIKTLKDKNPSCTILMLSSSVFFQTEKGYDFTKTNEIGNNLIQYVVAQRECCRTNKVPFLNLIETLTLTESDFDGDMLHYNESGYSKLVKPSLLLLACPEWFLL